jgi:hypothetical protein
MNLIQLANEFATEEQCLEFLSRLALAERRPLLEGGGFELPFGCPKPAYRAGATSHSATLSRQREGPLVRIQSPSPRPHGRPVGTSGEP